MLFIRKHGHRKLNVLVSRKIEARAYSGGVVAIRFLS